MIGILAGMGPRSTAPFIDMVVDECRIQYGAKDDIDFPPMMIYSLPTPFYIDKPVNHDSLKKVVCEGLRKLESTGADFIAIPCNTVHEYFDDLKSCINVPLLNIVDETLSQISGTGRTITILATQATQISKIYQSGVRKAGHILNEDKRYQDMVDELIGDIKSGKNRNAISEKFRELIEMLKENGTEITLIACTDLAPLAAELADMEFIDSSRSLAKAVVREYLELKRFVYHPVAGKNRTTPL